MVTRRLKQMTVDGQNIWHIGFPITWGFAGLKNHVGPLANLMTPTVGDANTWTPEYKTFLVRIEKAEPLSTT